MKRKAELSKEFRTVKFKMETLVILLGFASAVVLANPTHPCTPPKECPGGVNNDNGQACGANSIIETHNTGQNSNTKYCTLRNTSFQACPVPAGQCNEEEWWNMTLGEARCVNQATGAYTVLYTCAWTVLSKTRAGSLCSHCQMPD